MPSALRQSLALALAFWPLAARATPAAGAAAPPVAIEDTEGGKHDVPDKRLPVLVIYEDQHAGKQNEHARDVVGKISDRAENHPLWIVMAVGDLEKWNWWPAKKYALEDLRKISKKENTPLYCDWKGTVRRAWGLTRGKSGYLLVGSDGKVKFAAEGTLSETQLKELVAQLAALGLKT